MNFEVYKPQIAEIAEKYGLDLVVLFGSQATGHVHQKSDIDIAVLSKHEFNTLAISVDMSKLMKREDLEVVNLGKVSPTLMRAVVKEGKLLYERHSAGFLLWKIYAMKVWMETDWLRRLAYKNLIEWAEQIP